MKAPPLVKVQWRWYDAVDSKVNKFMTKGDKKGIDGESSPRVNGSGGYESGLVTPDLPPDAAERGPDSAATSLWLQAYLREIEELLPVLRKMVDNELAAGARNADSVGFAAIIAGMDLITETEGPDRAAAVLQELASMISAGRLGVRSEERQIQ